MQSVFFDALAILRIAAAGAFAAQPPAHLVKRDVVIVLPARLVCEVKRGGHGAHTAA